jgi:alanine dehydrogenase
MGSTDGTPQGIAPSVVGLPRMHMEAGERRDFLPEFVAAADRAGAGEIVLEHGYGSGMGFGPEAYLTASAKVRFADYAEVLSSDVVTVIRCPGEAALRSMRPGALLITMLHYPTRPRRTRLVADLGLRAISLDGVVDDLGRRQVEYLEAVGWNGVRLAFVEIAKMHPHFAHPSRRPLRVTCLGAGAVGAHAVRAATRYGDPELRAELAAHDVPGVEVTVVDFDLTRHEDYLLGRLEVTDLLIDATQRLDATRPIVPNPWIAALPADAVILDLAVDPYDFTVDPPRTKGIEGVPHGNLDRYVFPVDDPAWDALDHGIDTRERRLALSCYAWPGIEPVDCMRVYGRQIEPVVGVALRVPVDRLDVESADPQERAVAHAELGRWLA